MRPDLPASVAWLLVGVGAAVAVIAGLALTWRHRRSARIGDHTHCAACGRDLHGLDVKGARRCPECGADLTAADSMTPGAPAPNRRAQGFFMVVALGAGMLAYKSLRSVDYAAVRLRIWPTSWLIADLPAAGTRPIGGYPSDAAVELDRRIQSGAFAGERLASLVERLHPITSSGRLAVRAGDEWPIQTRDGVAVIIWHTGSEPEPRYRVLERLSRYRFGDRPWVEVNYSWQIHPLLEGQHTSWIKVPTDLPPGPTKADLEYAFRLMNGPWIGDAYNFAFVHEWSATQHLGLTVLPSDASDIALVVDPQMRKAMADAVAPGKIYESAPWTRAAGSYQHGIVIRRRKDQTVQVTCNLDVTNPPVALACDVFLRDPQTGTLARIAQISVPANRRTEFQTGSGSSIDSLTGWTSSRGDLILRPSQTIARATTDLTQIWGEDIVIPNVRIWRVGVDRSDDTVERGPATLPAQ